MRISNHIAFSFAFALLHVFLCIVPVSDHFSPFSVCPIDFDYLKLSSSSQVMFPAVIFGVSRTDLRTVGFHSVQKSYKCECDVNCWWDLCANAMRLRIPIRTTSPGRYLNISTIML
jgi:hypothetical protein